MAIYTAQWEMKAATKDQRKVEAEQARLTRVFWSAGEVRQLEEQPRLETSTLRTLLTSLGHMRA